MQKLLTTLAVLTVIATPAAAMRRRLVGCQLRDRPTRAGPGPV